MVQRSIAGTIALLDKRIALYSSALNTIEDYFEYRAESVTDKTEVYAILTNLATSLRDNANGNR